MVWEGKEIWWWSRYLMFLTQLGEILLSEITSDRFISSSSTFSCVSWAAFEYNCKNCWPRPYTIFLLIMHGTSDIVQALISATFVCRTFLSIWPPFIWNAVKEGSAVYMKVQLHQMDFLIHGYASRPSCCSLVNISSSIYLVKHSHNCSVGIFLHDTT